jgi:hypothetical protein
MAPPCGHIRRENPRKQPFVGRRNKTPIPDAERKKITALRGEKYKMVAPCEERNKMAALRG